MRGSIRVSSESRIRRGPPHPDRMKCDPASPRRRGEAKGYVISHTNPLPLRLILPADGEGKCAGQHRVAVSQ